MSEIEKTKPMGIKDLFAEENQYNINLELPFSKTTIKMREMITADQKSFLKSAAQLSDKDFVQRKIGVLFNDLLEKISENLDISAMTLQDKLYVLLYLRSRLRGDKSQLSIPCQKCKKSIKFTYSLDRFTDKVKKLADSVETPKTCQVGGAEMVIDAIMIKEEIESDTLLSDAAWVKSEELGESEIANLMRVASAIKKITLPGKTTVDMTEYHMKDRYEALMRMPAKMMTEIVDDISVMLKATFDMMGDKIVIPCLQDNCDGKTEVNIQIGDEGFFIEPSSV